jgi:hypothetical protein
MADEMKADALSVAVPCCSRIGRSWSLSERLNRVVKRFRCPTTAVREDRDAICGSAAGLPNAPLR